MTTIAHTRDSNIGTTAAMVIQWAALASGDQGEAVPFANYADRSVQVFGTFGTGGSITIEGSNDGTNWATMHDLTGSALTFTTAGVRMAAEITRFIRPNVTSGDGTTALTVSMLVRGA